MVCGVNYDVRLKVGDTGYKDQEEWPKYKGLKKNLS